MTEVVACPPMLGIILLLVPRAARYTQTSEPLTGSCTLSVPLA
jgi:hypothetical protein